MHRINDGVVTVLDVRPEDEYALGHLPGAVSMPLEALGRQLKTLDPKREVVAYCRGAYCVLAFEAVALLRTKGFKVRRLEDGFPSGRPPDCPLKRPPIHDVCGISVSDYETAAQGSWLITTTRFRP